MDWPPVPNSIDSVGSQSLKSVFLGTEGSNTVKEAVAEQDQKTRKPEKPNDPHRSLPPIPGGWDPGSDLPNAPLAWVSRAVARGTGPYIPMCQSSEDIDDMVKSHFYDDIDQIRKIAQERAMMIRRREEEEARQHSTDQLGSVEERISIGEMPDLIPNAVEFRLVDGEEEENVVGRCIGDQVKKGKHGMLMATFVRLCYSYFIWAILTHDELHFEGEVAFCLHFD